MSEYTPITQELRELVSEWHDKVRITGFEYEAAMEYCGAIDALHKNLEDENERLFAEVQRLTQEREQTKASDEQYDRDANWMKLPVDADGMTIHENDLMMGCDGIELVTGVTHNGYFTLRGESWVWLSAADHHHAPPTIESILREYTEHLCELCTTEYACDTTREELMRQYADKLRALGGE